eukprot:tig00001024_g6327.t1
MSEVDEAAWNRMAAACTPFVDHRFLRTLEESGVAGEGTGWRPMHLTLHAGPRMVAGVPLYLKSHSLGEFIPQERWAQLAASLGQAYYPKALACVPFSPVSGCRVLTAPGEARGALVREAGATLKRLVHSSALSSVHLAFCTPEEASLLSPLGFLQRHGIQYHFRPSQFASFEEYLGALKSRRRLQIRRERRAVREAGITVRVLTGEQLTPSVISRAYELYASHRRGPAWGEGECEGDGRPASPRPYPSRAYLNRAWFELMGERMRDDLVVVAAYRGGRMIAATVNLERGGVFYGRYWGAEAPVPFLHFEVCYYAALEYCIARRLHRFEPGAGGEFKWMRGFEPTLVTSAHFFRNRVLGRAVEGQLRGELAFVADEFDARQLLSPLRPRPAPPPPAPRSPASLI